MTLKFLNLFFFLFSLSIWSQNDEVLLNKFKNEDIKVSFQEYLNQEKKTIEFFTTNAKPNKEDKLEISNVENIAYYDQVILELKSLTTLKDYIRYNFYDEKYKYEKSLIYERFKSSDAIIEANYNSRLKIIKTIFKNVKNVTDVDVLPTDVCQRLYESRELLQPTHDSCKNLGLSYEDETTCFTNYLRKNIANYIQRYLLDSEENIAISVTFQFIIDKEGNLVFDKFINTSGSLNYDLVIYKGFRKFASITVFCPAKHKDKNVAVYYKLPIKMVVQEE